jgi:hypothetical protein
MRLLVVASLIAAAATAHTALTQKAGVVDEGARFSVFPASSQ